MDTNYMDFVAEELQVSLEQPFKLLGKNCIVKLTKQGVFEWNCLWNRWESNIELLQRLLIGNCEIGVLLPKIGDTYYTVFWNEFYPSPKVFKCIWEDNSVDLNRVYDSNYFLTEQEALDSKTVTYNRLKGAEE